MDVDEPGRDCLSQRVDDGPGLGAGQVSDSLDALSDYAHIGLQGFITQAVDDRPVFDQDVEIGGRGERFASADPGPEAEQDTCLGGHLEKFAAVELRLHSGLLHLRRSKFIWLFLIIIKFPSLSTKKDSTSRDVNGSVCLGRGVWIE